MESPSIQSFCLFSLLPHSLHLSFFLSLSLSLSFPMNKRPGRTFCRRLASSFVKLQKGFYYYKSVKSLFFHSLYHHQPAGPVSIVTGVNFSRDARHVCEWVCECVYVCKLDARMIGWAFDFNAKFLTHFTDESLDAILHSNTLSLSFSQTIR